MARRKTSKIAIAVFTTLILTLLVVLPAAAANFTTWITMISGTTNDLNNVWGSAGTDIYAVGKSGTIRHFDGFSWKGISSGITTDLYGIWGDSSTDVFAVGSSGIVLHYDGSTWSSMISGTTNTLNGVWGTNGTNVFAVGNSGTIIHYDGSTWSSMTSSTTNTLNGVWGTNGSDVFAVGNSGTIIHYNGSIWSSMTSGTTNDLNGVWGATSTDTFAAGTAGTILRYSGSVWSSMSSVTASDLNAIWGGSNTDVFAVGDSGTISHYDGIKWSPMNRDTLTDLHSLWGTSSSYVLTTGKAGTILLYAPPAVTSISPIQGDQGTTINLTLIGTNLNNVNDVRFGPGIAVNSLTAVNSNQLTVNISIVSNASPGTRDVTVTTQSGNFNLPASFVVTQGLPTISSINPDQGKQGATVNVTLTGSNLTTTTAIQFGPGIAVNSFTALSADQMAVNITLNTDAAAGTRDVSVTTASGNFTLAGSFVVNPAIPGITSISPNQSNQEKTLDITIEGTNLTGASAVKLGTGVVVNHFNVLSANQLTVNISLASDATAGTRDVSITTPGGSFTLANSFTVNQALPVITSISPDQGSQGTTLNITIGGMNFSGASEVRLGADIAVYSFNIISSNQIMANITIVSGAALGAREVSVTTPGGTMTLPNGFTVTQSLPIITSVNPDLGSQGAMLSVIISGSNFSGANAVSFGNDIVVENFTNLSPTQLKVELTIDKGAETGLRDISITTPGGSSVLGNGFNIKQGSLGTVTLALTWTGIGIIIVVFIVILEQLRRKRAAKL